MEINYILSEQDYLTSQEMILDYSKTFKQMVRIQRIGSLLITLAFLFKIAATYGWQLSFLTVSLYLIALILFLSLFFIKRINKRRNLQAKLKQAQNRPGLFTLERTLQVSVNKIQMEISHKNTKTIKWSIIQKVLVSSDFIIYCLNDNQGGVLACPAMQLTNLAKEELLQIISNALPKERVCMYANKVDNFFAILLIN